MIASPGVEFMSDDELLDSLPDSNVMYKFIIFTNMIIHDQIHE